MYLSRIALNEARISTRRLLSSAYKLHAAVEASFPPNSVRKNDEGRILWRIDSVQQSHETWLYVVSPEKPDFTHIVEQAGWPVRPEWQTTDYSQRLENLAVGQHWAFRLRANPVRTVKEDKGKNPNPDIVGKVMGHVTVQQQLQWLLDRAERHGFRILDTGLTGSKDDTGTVPIPACEVSQRTVQRFEHKGSKMTLSTAQFDGLLEVTNAEFFRKTLGFGLGRAKGFGCGLLTIAAVHSHDGMENVALSRVS